MMMTKELRARIADLYRAAAKAGDWDRTSLCVEALAGDAEALAACLEILK